MQGGWRGDTSAGYRSLLNPCFLLSLKKSALLGYNLNSLTLADVISPANAKMSLVRPMALPFLFVMEIVRRWYFFSSHIGSNSRSY